MSHIRDEADKSFEALKEAIAIGEGAHVAVQISHIKLGTVGVWHKSAEAIALIEAARARGVDVTADAYPYNAWSSTITVLVPDKRYDYPPSVEKALADVGGAGNVLIVRHAAHPEYEFHTLDALAKDQQRTAGRSVHPDRQGRRRRRRLHVDGRRRYPRVLRAAVGDGRQRRRHRARATRAAPARSRACSAATSATSSG